MRQGRGLTANTHTGGTGFEPAPSVRSSSRAQTLARYLSQPLTAIVKLFSRGNTIFALAALVDGLLRGSWRTPVPAGGMNEEQSGADNTGAKRLTFSAAEVYSPCRTSIPGSSGAPSSVSRTRLSDLLLGLAPLLRAAAFVCVCFLTVTLHV